MQQYIEQIISTSLKENNYFLLQIVSKSLVDRFTQPQV